MSDYHILAGTRDGNTFSVAMHFPVPNVNNEVGVNYRVALIQWLGGSQPSQVPFTTSEEQIQLDAGELYERSFPFDTHPGETLIEKRDRIDAMYTARQPAVQQVIQNILQYWGYNRDVP